MDISSLPDKVQKLIEKAQKGVAKLAPKLFREAMQLVWDNEVQYAPANLLIELDAVAEGMCSVLADCDVGDWTKTLQQVSSYTSIHHTLLYALSCIYPILSTIPCNHKHANNVCLIFCACLCDIYTHIYIYTHIQVNMLPELIRMSCTAYGAWGKATTDGQQDSGNLLQVRVCVCIEGYHAYIPYILSYNRQFTIHTTHTLT